MFRVCYMVYLQQNKPPKSIHVSGDWNWTLLLLVTPEVCSEGWSWTGPRRVGSWLPRSVPAMTSQNWDLASLTWRIWASAGEGCFSGNVLLSWKNPVKMVPVAAKKNAENCEKSWTKCFESRSRCVQLHQLALRAYPLRLRISIGLDHFHKITWSCSKGMWQCRWADWSTASNVCDRSTSSDRLEITLIPFWHRMIQCMAPLQKRPGLKRSYHFDFHMILHFNVGMIPIRLVWKVFFLCLVDEPRWLSLWSCNRAY